MPTIELLGEPKLVFGKDRTCADPKVGLLSYGPSGIDVESGENRIVNAGAIGTYSAINQLKLFLSKLTSAVSIGIASKPQPWKLDFPGLGRKGPLGLEIVLDESAVEFISSDEEFSALKAESRTERIENAVALYEKKFETLAATTHPAPHIVMIPLSKALVQECKDPRYKVDRILYQRRSMAKTHHMSGAIFDFHHVLKVLSFGHKLTCQVLLPRTTIFETGVQDPATICWNFATAVYYKATGTPWKLADLDEKTCLVGISFYEEQNEQGASMRASMAHVYVKSGESQIIRGKPFRWESADPSRQPNLTTEHAKEILIDVLTLYKDQQKRMPSRLVVHKSSPFTEDEISGFNDASVGIPETDYVHIDTNSGVRFFHEGEGYPPVRGSLISSPQSSSSILYSVGFIPSLGTYQGGTIPTPLMLNMPRLDSNLSQVGRDVLCLSKLDWNSTDFCAREPVTTSVSRKVGHILAEMRARDLNPPQSYRYYM
jgi:hypothetical protein